VLSWTCAGIVVAIAGAIFWQANRRPAVNQAQAKAMLPVIGAAEGAERAGFVAELKAVLTRYLAPYLSISADAPRSR